MTWLKPLAGIRVLDLTNLPPGATATVVLADLGAEIVKVEPPAARGNPSLLFGQVGMSRGKRSITVDTRRPEGYVVLNRLAPSFDIVIENFRPGAMEERGFGYSHARAANPGIIWVAITAFGQDGPYKNHPGHDINFLAHSGLLAALHDVPWSPNTTLAIQAGGLAAVIGVQSALIERGHTGEGAFIDISLSESAGYLLTSGYDPLADEPSAFSPTLDRRQYLCADGRWVSVACLEPSTWGALVRGLGLPDLADWHDTREDPAGVEKTLEEVFATKPAMEWVSLLADNGAAVTPTNHGSQLMDDPQVKARSSVLESAGIPVPRNPVRVTTPDGREMGTALDAPHSIGDDTVDVLASAGFTPHEISELEAAGVI